MIYRCHKVSQEYKSKNLEFNLKKKCSIHMKRLHLSHLGKKTNYHDINNFESNK